MWRLQDVKQPVSTFSQHKGEEKGRLFGRHNSILHSIGEGERVQDGSRTDFLKNQETGSAYSNLLIDNLTISRHTPLLRHKEERSVVAERVDM